MARCKKRFEPPSIDLVVPFSPGTVLDVTVIAMQWLCLEG